MICVTGAAGHLGNNLVRTLVGRGEHVRCFALPGEDLKPLSGLDVEVVTGDVRDYDSLVQAFRGADLVFHLASVISLTPRTNGILEDVNVGGTRNVVRACLETGVSRLVYTSSIHALVEPPHGVTIDEGVPCDPSRVRMAYGKSKARATLEVFAGVQKGLDAVIILPTGMIGPNDYRPSEMGRFMLDFVRGKIPVSLEGGYDFVDVRDVAEGHVEAALRGKAGSMYILSGEWISIQSLMGELASLTDRNAPKVRLPSVASKALSFFLTGIGTALGAKPLLSSDAASTVLSNSSVSSEKARRELGFRSRPLRETIRDTVEWFKSVGMLAPGSDGTLKETQRHRATGRPWRP